MLRYIKSGLRALVRQITYMSCSIGSEKECNACNWNGRCFRKFVMPEKPAPCQVCPRCRSLERHRLAFYLLQGKLGTRNTTFHVAPEKIIENWLRSISVDYLSIDIGSRAMRKMDLTNLELEDSSFNLIWCSHVLEHIPDDTKAMLEMLRVLRSGGTAIIQVPIYGDKTYEDFTITTPDGRLKHFKQEDHVRLYGLDIVDRLQSVGFDVNILNISTIPARDIERHGLDYPSTREIFICRKP